MIVAYDPWFRSIFLCYYNLAKKQKNLARTVFDLPSSAKLEDLTLTDFSIQSV